jgi:hypothetical protein
MLRWLLRLTCMSRRIRVRAITGMRSSRGCRGGLAFSRIGIERADARRNLGDRVIDIAG